MKQVTIKQVKEGDLFHFKDDPDSKIYVRNHYDRGSKTFSYSPYDNVNEEHFARPTRKVFID